MRRTSFLTVLVIGLVASASFTSCTGEADDAGTTTTPPSTPPSTFPPLPTTTVATTPSVLIVGDFLTTDTNGLGLEDAITRVVAAADRSTELMREMDGRRGRAARPDRTLQIAIGVLVVLLALALLR